MKVALTSAITSVIVGAIAGCTPEVPDLPDLGPARAFSAEVRTDAPMASVEVLARGHETDPRLPCDGFPAEHLYPSCELSHDSAITFVRDTLDGLGYETRVLDQGSAPLVTFNVVGERRGTTRPDEVVLLASHLDAFFAGADDDSSGVAVMLEVARAASTHRFARTLRFVSFDLEERGARGSTRYVEAGHADDVVAALVLESVGYADRGPGSQDSPPGLPLGDTGDTLALAANGDSMELAQRMMGIEDELRLQPLHAVVATGSGAHFFTGALLRSDNGPLWLRGIPALMLTDTANYRNPNYHLATDTPDTLDAAFLAGVSRVVAASIAVFAEIEP